MKKEFNTKIGISRTPKKNSLTRGFTLLETLVGVAIFLVIVGALTLLAKNIWAYNSFIGIEFSNINAGRQALKTMVAEIRTASAANTGAYAVSSSTPSSFTFYSDIYDNGLKEKVRYFLNGTTLQKGVIKPTGSPPSYNAASEVVTTLISNVIGSSIFEYYDKNYNGATAAMTAPIDPSAVRLVKITISADPNPNLSPTPIIFTTQVSLRNLKDNL